MDAATAAVPRLRMSAVQKSFGATRALRNVSFEVAAGEVHVLIGENGAGKSTLMKILSGALRPDAGIVELDGQPFVPDNPLHARRHGVAMIYQELTLAPHLSVEENILLGENPRGSAGSTVPPAAILPGTPWQSCIMRKSHWMPRSTLAALPNNRLSKSRALSSANPKS